MWFTEIHSMCIAAWTLIKSMLFALVYVENLHYRCFWCDAVEWCCVAYLLASSVNLYVKGEQRFSVSNVAHFLRCSFDRKWTMEDLFPNSTGLWQFNCSALLCVLVGVSNSDIKPIWKFLFCGSNIIIDTCLTVLCHALMSQASSAKSTIFNFSDRF